MARIVKEHDVRLGELLDLSERLFYQNGYENTSVQQIINAAAIAKGTFYHYFSSKEELLDQIVTRAVMVAHKDVESIIDNQKLSAIEKFRLLIERIGSQKPEQAEAYYHHARILFDDNNLRLREKLYEDTEKMTAPLIARVIVQGVREGSFRVSHPAATAEMILHMGLFIKDYTAHLVLHPFDTEFPLEDVRMRIEAFAEGIARLLGLDAGPAEIIDIEAMMEQFRVFEKIVAEHSGVAGK